MLKSIGKAVITLTTKAASSTAFPAATTSITTTKHHVIHVGVDREDLHGAIGCEARPIVTR